MTTMTCDPLAVTGRGDDLGWLLLLSIGCVVIGLIVLVLSRRSSTRRGAVTVAAVLLLGVAIALPADGDAHAASGSCSSTAENSLTVVQTSTIEGLAPGIAPVAIAGTLTNNGTDDTVVSAVDVEIRSITKASGAPAGHCGPSDYVILDARMLVDRALAPLGGTTTFEGASIGFAESSLNQDACKLATVHLHYTANPGGAGS